MKNITFKRGINSIIGEIEKNKNNFRNKALQRIDNFNETYNLNFPDDFKNFILQLEIVVSYFETWIKKDKDKIYQYSECIDFPKGYTFYDSENKFKIKIGELYSIHPKAKLNAIRFFNNEGKKHFFPFSYNENGDVIVIDTTNNSNKLVYLWNNKTSKDNSDNPVLICESFSDFIGKLINDS